MPAIDLNVAPRLAAVHTAGSIRFLVGRNICWLTDKRDAQM
ncbi:hypothetical protein [Streptomyces armeniacus]|nr:hypothetical protein [Streptomyces armeniacus]